MKNLMPTKPQIALQAKVSNFKNPNQVRNISM